MMLSENEIDGNNTSSAYSSLNNFNDEIIHKQDLSPTLAMSTSSHNMSQEIRSIIDDYAATITKATKEIKSLTKAKAEVENAYEELMVVNESLLKDLKSELQLKKKIEAERDKVIQANEELFNETQRLSDKESLWSEEKLKLEQELINVTEELSGLKNELYDVEALESETAEKNQKLISTLKTDKLSLQETITELELENKRLRKELEMAEEERDAILSRKEMVSGENMQLIVEAEHFRAVKSDLLNQVKTLQDRCKELERENGTLRSATQNHSNSDVSSEKFASLVERNKLLSEWREQLIEKNQVLTDENKKLKDKCSTLEDLLNEEETDISDVLELIRSMQLASKNGTSVGPISPMSAVAARLRKDFK